MKIILASASPRRCELIKLITDSFEVIPADVDETIPEDVPASEAAVYLACKKAEAVKAGGCAVIGCDTSVVIDDNILGKPSCDEDCRRMLHMLSGKTHTVYTGTAIAVNGRIYSFTEATQVEFYKLSEEEINWYISTGEPFDKAGGYGIQGRGALLVRSICGDYFNVVGLPVAVLSRKLKELGII